MQDNKEIKNSGISIISKYLIGNLGRIIIIVSTQLFYSLYNLLVGYLLFFSFCLDTRNHKPAWNPR